MSKDWKENLIKTVEEEINKAKKEVLDSIPNPAYSQAGVDELVEKERKKERERFSSWIAEACAFDNDLISMAKRLRKYLSDLT